MIVRRGRRTFDKLFNEDNSTVQTPKRKGRSAELISKRNACLVDRFLFYALTTKIRYEAIIPLLSEEFFLSTGTIPEILEENQSLILAQKKELKTLDQVQIKKRLTDKWEHLAW